MSPSRPHSLRVLTFPSKHWASPEPPSPTFSDATHISAIHLGPNGPQKIITRGHLKASVRAYENLVNASAEYRAALLSISKVTATFADALEQCSSLKGPSYDAGTRLQAASGLHHLIGNHWHVLAETMDKKFEKPLRQHLDSYRMVVNERSASYEDLLREKSQILRNTEKQSLNKRERNLQSFREALNIMQRQLDELDDFKLNHYREIVEHEEEVWDFVQAKSCIVVRSTMDVLDRFTAKASDPIIEVMLQSVPDPFDSYGPPPGEDQIFSILPPLSIMPTTMGSSPSLPTSLSDHEAGETLTPSPDQVLTWLPEPNNEGTMSSESTEWARMDTSTPPSSTPPRSLSPPVTPRKQSSPGRRKSGSGLRSVLAVIDETAAQPDNNPDDVSTPSSSPPINGRVTPPAADTTQNRPPLWSLPFYGHSPYEDSVSQSSELFLPSTDGPPVPPKELDEHLQTAVDPLVSGS